MMLETSKEARKWNEFLREALENQYFLTFKIPGSRVNNMLTYYRTRIDTVRYLGFKNMIRSSTQRAYTSTPKMAYSILLKEQQLDPTLDFQGSESGKDSSGRKWTSQQICQRRIHWLATLLHQQWNARNSFLAVTMTGQSIGCTLWFWRRNVQNYNYHLFLHKSNRLKQTYKTPVTLRRNPK